ncbi:MAG: hydrogenase maturation nickel metallochaperone HypA [Fidelibacterota bacterium]
MSLAINIVEIAAETAGKERASAISQIEIEVGQLAGVMMDSLTFCFDAASKNTPAEGSRLKVTLVPGQGECFSCSKIFSIDSLLSSCPHCGAYGVRLLKGDELKIKSITINEGVNHV